MEIQRHVPMFQKAQKTDVIPRGSPQLRGAYAKYRTFAALRSESLQLSCFLTGVRRGVLHMIVASILLHLSEKQPFVIVALESSGTKSSCNAASLM